MEIFDAHCDVLMKLFSNPQIDFKHSEDLQVTNSGLKAANIRVQVFAIYIAENVHPSIRFDAALAMVDIFYDQIIDRGKLKFIRQQEDIYRLKEGETGAVLMLEGCDCIGSDLLKLKTLLRLGVTIVGLTWNWANLVADGALENRGAGLTVFGKRVVELLNTSNICCDVSHLSERAFWDCMEIHEKPIATHSNCFALVSHPRNLSDEQILALIQKNSVIGLTFVPEFLNGTNQASLKDVLRHLDYVCSLGGVHHVGFGSDFDGSPSAVHSLERVEKYTNLVNELLKYYREEDVNRFLFINFASRYGCLR